jgi:Na+/H+ antiporter NhaD/arsenite permease-like protein
LSTKTFFVRLKKNTFASVFWQLLAYCAGVGGSMLIIGSAAGVVVMGLEKITFGWYMKHISWVAFVGYIAGILCYWAEKTLLF